MENFDLDEYMDQTEACVGLMRYAIYLRLMDPRGSHVTGRLTKHLGA